MKRFLITGAAGFVGYSLGRHLFATGHEVLGIARSVPPAASFPVEHGVLEPAAVARAVTRFRPDVILHAAGTASVPTSMTHPDQDFANSVQLLQQVLEGVRRTALRPRVVFPSSAAVYGQPDRLPIAETTPLRPVSAYGFHKCMCEELVREYAWCFDVPGLVVRLFSLFGMRQRRLLVWEIAEQFRAADEVVLYGSGDETRDYLHIDDMAEGLLLLLEAPLGRYETVNLASGEEITVRDLVRMIGILCGHSKPVRFRNLRPAAEPSRWRADQSRFREITGRTIAGDFAARLRQTVKEWSGALPDEGLPGNGNG